MANEPMMGMPEAPEAEVSENDGLGTKVMVFSTQDYPQLEGLAAGADVPKITHTGNKVKEAADGSVTIELGQCEFEVKNPADKAHDEMVGQQAGPTKTTSPDLEY